MIIDNILLYKNGWILGNFQPSLFDSNIDIGILRFEKGHKSDNHYHKLHTEYNIIIEGSAYVNGVLLSNGDIFIYKPMEKSKVEFIENTTLLVIKNPSTKNDKFY
jgi:quercetin dioxygenase-like cupin family protein